jgi:hypothetical protein
MLAVADINGDGKPDLIVESSQCCGSAKGVVGVLLGKGDGTFKPVVSYQSLAGGQGTSIAIADVKGDGKLDIVTTDQDAGANGLNKGLVSLRLGNGDGTFNAEQTYDSGGFLTNSVAVADLNGDGKPDLVVANICADDTTFCKRSSVGVLLNNTILGKSTTSTSLTSSLNPSIYGQKVTWTATVTSSGSVANRHNQVHVEWAHDRFGNTHQQRRGDANQVKSHCRYLSADGCVRRRRRQSGQHVYYREPGGIADHEQGHAHFVAESPPRKVRR